MTSPKIILSGGGTGGHIYPAIAIADEIKNRLPNAQILFVGARDKMEMEKVPKAGYEIKGLWISGLQRKNMLANVSFPLKLASSLLESNKILKSFQPDIAVGTGGFASGPLLWAASQKKIPIVIQEQNSFPGITNKMLRNRAKAICVAYSGMDQYFPSDKIHLTGNPIRSELFTDLPDPLTAKQHFELNPHKPVILSVGGSLGSRTLNNAWTYGMDQLIENDVQLIWQTGKLEYEKIKSNPRSNHPNVYVTDFIYNMKSAYAAADIIISRAGAMAISELCLIGKPTILVPYPYAAEDHQTKNAESLVKDKAAIMIPDNQAVDNLVFQSIELIKDKNKQNSLANYIKKLGKPNATKDIVNIVLDNLK